MDTLDHSARWGLLLVLAAGLFWVSGCDQGSLEDPDVSNDLFRSYVALGNSITAGFQSGGINESTQQQSYAVLLAEQMDTPFTIPTLRNPGCPPPLVQAFPPQRLAQIPCALRSPRSSEPLNNVAVPGAAVVDALTNVRVADSDTLTNANQLTSFLLGGRTQIQAAKAANPTFASVWIGNNDVLDAALFGDPGRATSVDSFEARYGQLVNELESIDTLEGAVFVGVADVTLIPHLSRGAAYLEAKSRDALPSNFLLQNCESADSGSNFVPFRHGASLLGVAQAIQEVGEDITLDCSLDRTVKETIQASIDNQNIEQQALNSIPDENKRISLLTTQETNVLENRVAAFNQEIQSQIADDYAYVNPNSLFQNNLDQIPAFPNLSGDEPFGPLFSLDGIHPSAAAHRRITNEIVGEIQSTYDVELPTVSTSSL